MRCTEKKKKKKEKQGRTNLPLMTCMVIYDMSKETVLTEYANGLSRQKMYLMQCAPREDLDQPAHPRSLISLHRPPEDDLDP